MRGCRRPAYLKQAVAQGCKLVRFVFKRRYKNPPNFRPVAVLPTLLEELECIWKICLLLDFLVDNCYGLSTCMATAEEQPLPIAAVIPSIFQ